MKSFSMYLAEQQYNAFDDSTINEMANLSKQSTSLPVIVYVSDSRGVNHGPRIKCNSGYGNWTGQSFTITIDNAPRVIGKVGDIKQSDVETLKDWVMLNAEHLLKYWNLEYGIAELLAAIRSV